MKTPCSGRCNVLQRFAVERLSPVKTGESAPRSFPGSASDRIGVEERDIARLGLRASALKLLNQL